MELIEARSALDGTAIAKMCAECGYLALSPKTAKSCERVFRCAFMAARAFANKQNIARSQEMEALLYLTGEHEISKAIAKNRIDGKHFALADIRKTTNSAELLKKICAAALKKTLPDKDADPLEMEALALSRQ
jgi:tRNA threonylcarbamoyladenosine modification (KEOPS) complex Cgi121 subunit